MFRPEVIILPGPESSLLRRELAIAFAEASCIAHQADTSSLCDPAGDFRLAELLDGKPALFLSINACGLQPMRLTLEKLARYGCRAAIWFVDNPWNVLSGVRDPSWRDLPLFVTDGSFIAPLKANGAAKVYHLPLAASFELFSPNAARDSAYPPPQALAPFVFVGRSAFPDKTGFFSGLDLPADACRESEFMMLSGGGRPDLSWWEQRLDRRQNRFWPGREARLPAFGAEESNRYWRSLCLAEAAAAGRALNAGAGESGPGLDIFGDTGWKALLPPGVRLRPPVDYYTRLPAIYAKAAYSMCLTSLQLPCGLNQRHFDVWAAGGFCVSDATPGLDIFPQELTRPIIFSSPAKITAVMEGVEKHSLRASLIRDWQACLREKHTYSHRVRTILQFLDGDS